MAIKDRIMDFINKYLKREGKQKALPKGIEKKEIVNKNETKQDFNESLKVYNVEDIAKEVFEEWKIQPANKERKTYFEFMDTGVSEMLVGDLVRISANELERIKYDDIERQEKTKRILLKNMEKFKLGAGYEIVFKEEAPLTNLGAHKTTIKYGTDRVEEDTVKISENSGVYPYEGIYEGGVIDYVKRTTKFDIDGKNESCPDGYRNVNKIEEVRRMQIQEGNYKTIDEAVMKNPKSKAETMIGNSYRVRTYLHRRVDGLLGSNYQGKIFYEVGINKPTEEISTSISNLENWDYEYDIKHEFDRENEEEK